jgi:class 3 adenylate cyclase
MLGLTIRAGLHTGECQVAGDKVTGIAVHIGARVATSAGPGEILITGTVRDLVAGSGLRFADRGAHTLKGVAGRWRLFALQS